MFSRRIKRDQWDEMGKLAPKDTKNLNQSIKKSKELRLKDIFTSVLTLLIIGCYDFIV